MFKAPVMFISHGAPTFALEPGKLGARLTTLGKELSGVRAVLVVSPHWQTQGLKVMANKSPATLHDFGGFPPALDDLQYPAPGHLQFAVEARRLLVGAGFEVSLDDQRMESGRDFLKTAPAQSSVASLPLWLCQWNSQRSINRVCKEVSWLQQNYSALPAACVRHPPTAAFCVRPRRICRLVQAWKLRT